MDYITFEDKKIRLITADIIEEEVKKLFIEVNHHLTDDVVCALKNAADEEDTAVGKKVLCRLCDNLSAACDLDVPICQDTGMAVVFAEIGEDVHILGDTLENAVNRGVQRAYTEGRMRLSIVKDPLYHRENTNDNTPAVVHIKTVKGDRLTLTAAPKGFGSENMSALKMFTPSASDKDIVDFVVQTVKNAGSNPCPPIVVGVGIGGNFEYSAILAKKALTRRLDDENEKEEYSELEKRMLEEINKLNIGPQGFGGKTTALAVKIETAPTHIAGLPVAVNINCHVARHRKTVI